MYRTPSHLRLTGEHAFGTPAKSTKHNWAKAGYHLESKDLLVHNLKRELTELKQNARSYNELASKLSNVEHRSTLLSDEKNKFEDEFKRRDEEQNLSVLTLESELNAVKEKLNSRLHDTNELHRAFDLLQIN